MILLVGFFYELKYETFLKIKSSFQLRIASDAFMVFTDQPIISTAQAEHV